MWLLLWLAAGAQAAPGAEERAVAYLAREVPLWSRQNHCYSCHNNGDGARALYVARRRGYRVPPEALADTTAWLQRPLDWENSPGDPRFSDKRLARIQFAASLAEASQDRKLLSVAAEALLPHQDAGGSWPVDAEAAVGSPVTYGPALATAMARRTLAKVDAVRFRAAIASADAWLRSAPLKSTVNAAAVLLALGEGRRQSLDLLLGGQGTEGGWGPYPRAPAEAFDTAVALLALASLGDRPELREPIRRGRAYLTRTQLESGGWPETTRPAGAQSYAQHVSTSAWATLALLETRR